MKESKKFQFEGVDAKTEWRLALMLIIPSSLVFYSVMYLFEYYLPKANFLNPVLFSAIFTIVISLLLLKLFAKTIKNKIWVINVNNQNLEILYKNNRDIIPFQDINLIKYLGNIGFRYLTIVTSTKNIKIRVGNTGLVPFSSKSDIENIDGFVEYISPFLKESFNKKELKNKINTNIFPNYGVYIEKSKVIKYSLINKLKPWQIMLLFLGLGFLLLIILFAQLEKYW